MTPSPESSPQFIPEESGSSEYVESPEQNEVVRDVYGLIEKINTIFKSYPAMSLPEKERDSAIQIIDKEEEARLVEEIDNNSQKFVQVFQWAIQSESKNVFDEFDSQVIRWVSFSDHRNPIRQIVLNIIEQNIEQLEASEFAFEAVASLIESENPEQSRIGIDKSSDIIIKHTETGEEYPDEISEARKNFTIGEIIRHGDEEDTDRLLPILEKQWPEADDSYGQNSSLVKSVKKFYQTLVDMSIYGNEEERERSHKVLDININDEKILAKESIYSILNKHKKEDKQRKIETISQDIQAMVELEKSHPGITTFLHQKCGISFFGRYPQQMLIDQFEHLSNPESLDLEKAYGIIINPYDDWNSSFHRDKEMISDLYQKTRHRYNSHIYEIGSKHRAMKSLASIRKLYSKNNNKAAWGIMGGHSDGHTILFGHSSVRSKSQNQLTADDLGGRGLRRASNVFRTDATIVLSACKAGIEFGIARKLSEVLNVGRVVGPKSNAGLADIDFYSNLFDKEAQADIKYAHDTEEGTYSKGEEI